MSDVESHEYKQYLNRDEDGASIPKRTRVRRKKRKLVETEKDQTRVKDLLANS